jgi:hypothetical protein
MDTVDSSEICHVNLSRLLSCINLCVADSIYTLIAVFQELQ